MKMFEKWAPIRGYEELYEVSSLGRVRSLDRESRNRCGTLVKRGKILKPYGSRGNGGNRHGIGLYRGGKSKTFAIHRLVLEAFVGDCPPGMECRHIDGDPSNNRVENLEWSNHSVNMLDRAGHGTVPLGENSPNSKLTAAEVSKIFEQLGQRTGTSLAEEYGVSPSAISSIRVGKTWQHVTNI
jgi:hypothetical protein